MQPPIPLGTVLQNRYRLIKILGQGGFGRTYLAEDQGRFNELCALKELIPAQMESYALEKSKQLFQREAVILYQIQHPQVPQFRATFAQDQRLFLVQDYVEGKTYRSLIDERKAAGKTFSEAEVLQLLRQLLPVLAHLHSRGIIHRDISPDNIILRDDAKPVLIDFGVVKELATRLQLPNTTYQPTTVGKFGYAPSEQIQTGRAYPSSDLYALAVTSIVLLTGREPQELFDDTQLSWTWQRWAKVSPELARVLNRMLSYKPSDRYQSVAEVAQALPANNHNPGMATASSGQTLPNGMREEPPQQTPRLPTLNRQPVAQAGLREESTPPQQAHATPLNGVAPELSQMQTVAVGRPPESNNRPNQPAAVIPAPAKREIWENPWAIAASVICVATVAGFSSWLLFSYLIANKQRTQAPPQAFPSPLVSESPTPTPTATTPTPTPSSTEPTSYSQHLNLTVGEATTVEASLKANATINYTFSAEQGQQLSTALAEEGVLLTVLGPNQEPIDDGARRVTRYQGTLPFTGDYTVQLSPVQGVTESNYKLNLSLESPALPTPTPTPTPTVTPTVSVESISPGETTTEISGQTSPQQIKRYSVNVQAGQLLSVDVKEGVVALSMRSPDGQLVKDACTLLTCQVRVPGAGEYQIDVVANQEQESDFILNVSLK